MNNVPWLVHRSIFAEIACMHWSWLLADRQSCSHNTTVSDYEMQTADAQ